MENLSLGDALALTGRGNAVYTDGGFGNGAFGGEWAWIIILFLIFGWGGFGRNGFGGGNSPDLQGLATRADINAGFSFNTLDNGIRAIQNGICDSTFALNNAITSGFTGVQSSLCNGFNSVNTGISNLGYNMQQCCCDIRYENAKNTCDIVNASNQNTQRILDKLCDNEIQNLRDQNNQFALQLSQQAQSANLLAQLRPTPVPSYIVTSPYQSINYGYGCGCNSGCNCGC